MKAKNNFKGVLFDFDGVLADTMSDHFAAWNHALGLYHTHVSSEDFYPLEGMPVSVMAAKICKKANVDISLALELLARKDDYYVKNHNFTFYPSVEKFIDFLHLRQFPIGIVSGGRYERIVSSTPAAFLAKFAAIVTSEHTARGKPYPDPYLEGARLLGFDPGECIVVENAPLGIQAAKSAGAYCVAIASTVSSDKLTSADAVVDTFADLSKLKVFDAVTSGKTGRFYK